MSINTLKKRISSIENAKGDNWRDVYFIEPVLDIFDERIWIVERKPYPRSKGNTGEDRWRLIKIEGEMWTVPNPIVVGLPDNDPDFYALSEDEISRVHKFYGNGVSRDYKAPYSKMTIYTGTIFLLDSHLTDMSHFNYPTARARFKKKHVEQYPNV